MKAIARRILARFGIVPSLHAYVIWTVSIAFVVRIAVLVYLVTTKGDASLFTGDSTHYLALADSVLQGHGFMYDDAVESLRAPGYPAYFMVMCLLGIPFVFGSVLQILFASVIAVWAVWFASTKLELSEKASLCVGLFLAVEPVQVYYSVLLLPDVFFAVATLATFTCILHWFETGRFRYVVCAGVAIAVGNYVRPVLIYVPVFLAGAFLVHAWWQSSGLKKAVGASLVIFLVPIIIMSPWYVRNKIVFGHYSFISAAQYNLFSYGAAATEAIARGVSYQQMKQELLARAQTEAPDPNLISFRNDEYFRTKALTIITSHPLIYVQQYAFGLGTFWTAGNYQYIFKNLGLLAPPSESVSYSMMLASQGLTAAITSFVTKLSQPFIAVALFDRVFGLSMFLLSLAGVIRYWRHAVAWLTALFFMYFSITILATVIGVEARHRYALTPLMVAFAVAALVAAHKRISRAKKGQ